MSGPTSTVAVMTISEHEPGRKGQYWTVGDYEVLVDGVQGGRLLEDLAGEVGRSLGAVAARLRWLIPSEEPVPRRRADRELWLREQLNAAEGYDWFGVLREHYAAHGTHLWTAAEDEQLRAAWYQRRGLPELVEQFGVGELTVALRCVQLGLAGELPSVVTQVGATPGGVVDVRARLAAERAAAAVWVVVVDGVGDRVSAFDGQRQHISVYPHLDAALDAVAELLAEVSDPDGVRYSIAERTVGEGIVGETRHGAATPTGASTADDAADDAQVSLRARVV